MDADDLVFEQVPVGPMANFAYVFGSRSAHERAIVDPGFEAELLVERATAEGARVSHVLVTHGHRDHVAELDVVRKLTDAQVVAHEASPVRADVVCEDREVLTVAGVPVEVVFAPGHSPDMLNFIVAERALLTGDALFIGECGRVDLPGSDVEAMWRTLMQVIPSLPADLEVYPGHDYGPVAHRPLATELEENYTLEPRDLAAFERFMAEP